MRDLCDRFQVDDDAAGIGQAFHEDGLAPRRQRAAEVLRLSRIDEMAGPAELRERQAELGERAAIEVARGHEFVARLQQREEGKELCRVAGGSRQRRAPALQRRHPLLQHRDGGIGEPRVDMAETVQVEQRGSLVDILEHERRGLVDRRRARAGGRVRRGTGMDRAGLEPHVGGARGRRARPDLARLRRLGRAVADQAGINAGPGEFAAQPPELDLRAAVHDDVEPGRRRPRRSGVVADAELHPHRLRPDRDRLVHHRPHLIGGPEDIHHVDGLGDVAQRGVDTLPGNGLAREGGVHRDRTGSPCPGGSASRTRSAGSHWMRRPRPRSCARAPGFRADRRPNNPAGRSRSLRPSCGRARRLPPHVAPPGRRRKLVPPRPPRLRTRCGGPRGE